MTQQTRYAVYLRQKIEGLMAKTTLTRADAWELGFTASLPAEHGGSELVELVGPDQVDAAAKRAWLWRQDHPRKEGR